jgi:hypothetical protein
VNRQSGVARASLLGDRRGIGIEHRTNESGFEIADETWSTSSWLIDADVRVQKVSKESAPKAGFGRQSI